MATNKAQRWFILVITVVMVVGTLGSFLVMILSTHENQDIAQRYQTADSAYQKEKAAYQELVDARDQKLSEKYYPVLKPYASQAAKYAIDSISKLSTHDLKAGTGETIGDETKFAAYYIGWNPDGKIFDQSIDGDKLKAPLYESKPEQGFTGFDEGLAKATVIDGWREGLKGMKIGGVRLLEIPSDKAYGETGQGDDIPPNVPLKFIILAIPAPEDVPEPESLVKAYEAYQKAMIEYYTQGQ